MEEGKGYEELRLVHSNPFSIRSEILNLDPQSEEARSTPFPVTHGGGDCWLSLSLSLVVGSCNCQRSLERCSRRQGTDTC